MDHNVTIVAHRIKLIVKDENNNYKWNKPLREPNDMDEMALRYGANLYHKQWRKKRNSTL